MDVRRSPLRTLSPAHRAPNTLKGVSMSSTPTHRGRLRRRLLAVAVATLAPATAIVVAAWPSEAASLPATGSAYQLASAKSGMCIDVPSGLHQTTASCSSSGAAPRRAWQQFTVKAVGVVLPAGQRQQRQVHRRARLRRRRPGVQLQQYGCVVEPDQPAVQADRQRHRHVPDRQRRHGLCISDKDASTASGGAIIQETCTATSTNKQWAFTAAGSGGGTGGGATCPCTVAADGTGKYTTVQAAIDAVPANNTTRQDHHDQGRHVPGDRHHPVDQALHHAAGRRARRPSDVVIVNNHSSAGGYGTAGSATFFANAARTSTPRT